jgi:hypothetical protein
MPCRYGRVDETVVAGEQDLGVGITTEVVEQRLAVQFHVLGHRVPSAWGVTPTGRRDDPVSVE